MLIKRDDIEDLRKQLESQVENVKSREILTPDCEGKFTPDRLGYVVSVPSSFPDSFLKQIHNEGFANFAWAGTTTEDGRRATLFQFNP